MCKQLCVLLLLLFFSMIASADPHGNAWHGGGYGKGHSSFVTGVPPGVEKNGMPPGLQKKGKTPYGWSKGEKTGWHNNKIHSHPHHVNSVQSFFDDLFGR